PIRIKLMRSDKMTGEIDFAHVASDVDILEKPIKGEKKDNFRRNRKSSDDKKSGFTRKTDKKTSSGKSDKKKAFYKEVAKKG
ncbi:ribonuclease R, partial [Streptococcus pyogenes]